jgi:hypothetical protein
MGFYIIVDDIAVAVDIYNYVKYWRIRPFTINVL